MGKKEKYQFGVKAEAKPIKMPSGLIKIKELYSRYKYPLWAAIGLLFITSTYYRGIMPTITNTLELAFGYVLIGNIWPLVKYIKNAKDEHQRLRRIAVLETVAVMMIGVALFIVLWFKDTNTGQALQRFLYHHNDINVPDISNIQNMLPQPPK